MKSKIKEINQDKINSPRILISALRGSGAKTILSLGIIIALRKKGYDIIPFKKGPDYIDAAWLSKAAEVNCRHLDLYLMGEKGVQEVFCKRNDPNAISIIEGNRGLYDGIDIHGTYSTARISKILDIPVILVVDCTKSTNTVASLVLGCQVFDPKVPLKGVILNRVAGKRHGDIIRKSIEYHTKIPIVGELPNLDIQMPERHLGLTTVGETGDFTEKLNILGDIAERYLNLDKILHIAKTAPQISFSSKPDHKKVSKNNSKKIKVGIIKDAAFQFYYPENIEALKEEGGSIIEFDSMKDYEVKDIDILYIAGGFPEIHADKISKNKHFRESIKRLAESGLPIYGECGAVIYLGDSVFYNNKKYDMCGVFPLGFELKKKPVGHGYTDVEVDHENPFFPKGTKFKGHEFHYSFPVNWKDNSFNTAFCVKKGHGLNGERDGIFKKNVFATYTHLHAEGTKDWAKWLINVARKSTFS